MLSEVILAYLAGVIDSDGYIGVRRSTYAMRVRKDASVPVYSERIGVKQVQPEAIELLHGTFGGHRWVEKPSLTRGKPLNAWEATSRVAAECLAQIRPYLLIKARQADNALSLRDLIATSKKRSTPGIVPGEPMETALAFARRTGSLHQSVLQACAQSSIPSIRVGRQRLIPISFAETYRERKPGGNSRSEVVSTAMEAIYEQALALNRQGTSGLLQKRTRAE